MKEPCECGTKHISKHDFSKENASRILIERVAQIEEVEFETVMDRVEPWQCEHLDDDVRKNIVDDDCLQLSFKDYKNGYCVHISENILTIGVMDE